MPGMIPAGIPPPAMPPPLPTGVPPPQMSKTLAPMIPPDEYLNNHSQNTAQAVVLTHLPPFLRGIRVLRDASFHLGAARTVHLGCCIPYSLGERRKFIERGLPVANRDSHNREVKKVIDRADKDMEALRWQGGQGGVAVVKMGHFIGAQNFVGAVLALAKDGLPRKPKPAESANESEAQAEDKEKTDEEKPPVDEPSIESEYTPEELTRHKKTLEKISNLHAYHVFNYHIPDPIPPDRPVPMPPTKAQDPNAAYLLLNSLTECRERYEESVKTEEDAIAKGDDGTALSTSVTYLDGTEWGGHVSAATGESELKMDKEKVAAAAGGVYDEENDPLNAPEVIRAVLAFKRTLEDRDAKSKKRRVDIINSKLEAKVKEMIEQGRKERDEMRNGEEKKTAEGSAGEAQVPSDAAGVGDTGRRGVSNLPAWMTKGDGATAATQNDATAAAAQPADDEARKRKFVPSEANREINARKQKLDTGEKTMSQIRAENEAADKAAAFVPATTKEGILAPTSNFPPLIPAASSGMKEYVTSQIVELLGEEEATLIAHIMTELEKGCKVQSMMEEMKEVLDEDSEAFVVGLYRKMLE